MAGGRYLNSNSNSAWMDHMNAGSGSGVSEEGRACWYCSGVGVPVSRECFSVGGSRFGGRTRRCVDGCPPTFIL